MLKIEHLYKKYKNKLDYSVEDFSLELFEGEIFGFLGHNGAGKSTTIKCITGILPYESGSINICGFDLEKDTINAKKNIGYVSDNHAVYENLTGREYINYMGNMYQVPKVLIESRLNKFAELFNMTNALDRQIMTYSHGMKQKVSVMAALIHKPKFWILDEPLMGLDPQSTFEIKECMKEHKAKGNTVFFSSHNIDLVNKLCDRVAIIKGGKLLEVIDVAKFNKESPITLEYHFLALTGDNPQKYLNMENIKNPYYKEKKVKKENSTKYKANLSQYKDLKIEYDDIEKIKPIKERS